MTLTTVLMANGPHGTTTTRTQRQPLTETALLEAGVRLLSHEPDPSGWFVVELRTGP